MARCFLPRADLQDTSWKRANPSFGGMKSRLTLVQAGNRSTKTHCPYCAFQCGMTLSVAGERGAIVRADPDFPVNRGQMCIKGFNSGALLRAPGRLHDPMLRGRDGKLHRTSWDEALAFIADKLVAIRSTHGADARRFW